MITTSFASNQLKTKLGIRDEVAISYQHSTEADN